jgi:probable rRNA maturation factor
VKIIINDWQKKEKVRKGRLKTLAEKVLELEGCSSETEVGIVLTDNRKIRGLNKKYRKVDRATDVIAFPMEKTGLLGDVVISLERAKSQSREYKHSFEKELAVLVIHGLLHLLGYDHLKKSEAEVMAKRERAILKKVISTAEEGG